MSQSSQQNTANDPIGPGSPAWNAYEAAVAAYCRTPPLHHNGDSPSYRSYRNHRSYMLTCLRLAHTPEPIITVWLRSLKRDCQTRAMNDQGEWVA